MDSVTSDIKKYQEVATIDSRSYLAAQDDIKNINKRLQESRNFSEKAIKVCDDFIKESRNEDLKKAFTETQSFLTKTTSSYNKIQSVLDTYQKDIEKFQSELKPHYDKYLKIYEETKD